MWNVGVCEYLMRRAVASSLAENSKEDHLVFGWSIIYWSHPAPSPFLPYSIYSINYLRFFFLFSSFDIYKYLFQILSLTPFPSPLSSTSSTYFLLSSFALPKKKKKKTSKESNCSGHCWRLNEDAPRIEMSPAAACIFNVHKISIRFPVSYRYWLYFSSFLSALKSSFDFPLRSINWNYFSAFDFKC